MGELGRLALKAELKRLIRNEPSLVPVAGAMSPRAILMNTEGARIFVTWLRHELDTLEIQPSLVGGEGLTACLISSVLTGVTGYQYGLFHVDSLGVLEGAVWPGSYAVVVSGAFNNGYGLLESIKALTAKGCKVLAAFSLVSGEPFCEHVQEQLRAHEVSVSSLFSLEELLNEGAVDWRKNLAESRRNQTGTI